jgi:hypothetical protein
MGGDHTAELRILRSRGAHRGTGWLLGRACLWSIFHIAPSIEGHQKIAYRIGTIYAFHIGTLLIVAAILVVISRVADDVTLLELMRFQPLLSGEF